ncbi:MAG: hypothetical protein Q9169_000320 [Polycauliona sp. 2 TL-2023]
MILSLVVLSRCLHQSLAAPSPAEIDSRALQNRCNGDNLYNSFIDRRFSASASAFCSSYIQPTITATTIVTTTVPVAKEKRQFATPTYPPARLSSACSCILTATPPATTVQTIVVATVQPAGACSASTPVVKNGDFETGSLAPWALTQVTPPLPDYEQYLSAGVDSPGYGGSKNAFTVKDNAASSYVEIELSQTLNITCAGSQHSFAAQFYMTDAQAVPSPQTYVYVYVDGSLVASSKASDARGPPVVWLPLSGRFIAASETALLTVKFIATDYLGVEWGLDNVSFLEFFPLVIVWILAGLPILTTAQIAGALAFNVFEATGRLPSGCTDGYDSAHDEVLYTVPYTYPEVLSVIGSFGNITWNGINSTRLNGTDSTVGTARTFDYYGLLLTETIKTYQKPVDGPYFEDHTLAPSHNPATNLSLYASSDALTATPVCDGTAVALNFTVDFCSTDVDAAGDLFHSIHLTHAMILQEFLGNETWTGCKHWYSYGYRWGHGW